MVDCLKIISMHVRFAMKSIFICNQLDIFIGCYSGLWPQTHDPDRLTTVDQALIKSTLVRTERTPLQTSICITTESSLSDYLMSDNTRMPDLDGRTQKRGSNPIA